MHDRLLGVRWERLFDDLEAQLAAGEQEELAAEVADRTRLEVARLRLADRLRPATGARVEVSVQGVGPVSGVLQRSGPGWLLLDVSSAQVVVGAGAILAIGGLAIDAAGAESAGAVAARLDLAHILRAIARDRAPVSVMLVDGSARSGTIDRVGADFLDLAEHPLDQPRRPDAVAGRRVVRLAAVATIRTG